MCFWIIYHYYINNLTYIKWFRYILVIRMYNNVSDIYFFFQSFSLLFIIIISNSNLVLHTLFLLLNWINIYQNRLKIFGTMASSKNKLKRQKSEKTFYVNTKIIPWMIPRFRHIRILIHSELKSVLPSKDIDFPKLIKNLNVFFWIFPVSQPEFPLH